MRKRARPLWRLSLSRASVPTSATSFASLRSFRISSGKVSSAGSPSFESSVTDMVPITRALRLTRRR